LPSKRLMALTVDGDRPKRTGSIFKASNINENSRTRSSFSWWYVLHYIICPLPDFRGFQLEIFESLTDGPRKPLFPTAQMGFADMPYDSDLDFLSKHQLAF
jgi:hypothetical protein